MTHRRCLRPLAYVSTLVLMMVALTAVASAQASAGGRETRAQREAAQRQQDTNDQLRAIAAELAALRQQQAEANRRAAALEARRRQNSPTWTDITSVAIGTIAAAIGLFTLRALVQQVRANVASAESAKNAAEVSAASLAISERAYLSIGDWKFGGINPEQTIFFYWFAATGRTPATILGGEIRLSVDGPVPVQPHLDPRFVQPVTPQVLTATMRPHQMVVFPNLPAEVVEAWNTGNRKFQIYLAGTIRYRDAFPNTPIHVRYFSVACFGPDGAFIENNPDVLTLNYEKDES